MVKINRHYRILDKVAKELLPVTESEKKCAITRREHEGIREKYRTRMAKHLYNVDDGMVIRLRN